MKKSYTFLLGIFSLSILTFTGCRTADDFRKERAEFAAFYLEKSKLKVIPDNKVFALDECIKTALKHNLDLKVYELETAVEEERRTAEMLGMLPELNISNTLTGRNNTPGSSSKKIDSSGATYGASQSTDRNVNVFNIDLALSVLDFGLSYFNTMQSNDRTFLRKQESARAAQNLTFDVVKTYFRVAVAQRSILLTKQLLEQCRNKTRMIEKLGRERKISPFRMFDENRRFVNLEKRLTAFVQEYETACIELRTLMGYLPNASVKVDDSCLDKVPEFYLPPVEDMERIALLNRPELSEADIQRHITKLESYKTILMMFPNVRMFVDFTNSNNAFLYHSSWWEIGIRAAYNLLKLPQQIATYRAIDGQIDVIDQRTWALTLGVMSQVRIAQAGLSRSRDRYDIDKRVYDTYKDNRDFAKANRQASGTMSQLELDRIELETAETEINSMISLGNCYVAYYRILNVLGMHSLTDKDPAKAAEEMKAAAKRIKEKIDEARKKADKENKSAVPISDKEQKTPESNEKVLKESADKGSSYWNITTLNVADSNGMSIDSLTEDMIN